MQTTSPSFDEFVDVLTLKCLNMFTYGDCHTRTDKSNCLLMINGFGIEYNVLNIMY